MATWTDPKTWTAAVVTVADLNTHVRDNLSFVYSSPSLQVTKTAQSISDATLTEVDWTAADWDNDDNGAMWASGANSAHLVVKTAGIYLVNWDIQMATGSRDYLLEVLESDVAIGGNGPINDYNHGGSALEFRFAGSMVRDLAANAFITFKAYHNTSDASARNVEATSRATLQWLRGPQP